MNSLMPRPTLLIVEPEPSEALSVRKLVMETAKFNVLTAHSTREALEIVRLFPRVSAAVIVAGEEMDCESLGKAIKATGSTIPIVFLTAHIGSRCTSADHQLSSHEPQELLNLMRSMLGDPRQLQN